MVEASVSAMSYFMPIFAFLLVFIVLYALLKSTKVLGDSEAIMLFISFVLSSFFIVEARLVELVQFAASWFGVIAVGIFFLVLLVAFVPGLDIGKFFGGEKGWFGMVVFGLMVAFFIISSSYVFNWAVNWGMVRDWFNTDWFGMVLLLVIAGIVSFVISKK